MTAFLENRGLPVSTPLHIVIDDMLDEPRIRISILPHREIRIGLAWPLAQPSDLHQSGPTVLIKVGQPL